MPKRIFIIDDDLGLQTVLSIALRDAGYDVVLASDGEQGLARLPSVDPDLVISDIMMPNLDGVQVFRTIKERLASEGIPIIIITALNPKAWFADLESEGAVIIQKPFEMEFLLEMIGLLLENEPPE